MTTTDEELLALASQIANTRPKIKSPLGNMATRAEIVERKVYTDWVGLVLTNAERLAKGYLALGERYRAERAEWDAHAGQWEVTLDEQRAEVERLTRERDEARELAGEAKCKNCDTPIAKCQQSRRDGFLTCCPECDHASAESALHAAQKRIAELEAQQRATETNLRSVSRAMKQAQERAALAGGTASR